MTSGLVDGVIITAPPWKISGGVPLAGSLFLMAPLAAAQWPPVGAMMPEMWPTRDCCAQACGAGDAALAAIGVAIASIPAARVRAAPRLHRLCAFFILPPRRGDLQAVCRSIRHELTEAEHTLSLKREQST